METLGLQSYNRFESGTGVGARRVQSYLLRRYDWSPTMHPGEPRLWSNTRPTTSSPGRPLFRLDGRPSEMGQEPNQAKEE